MVVTQTSVRPRRARVDRYRSGDIGPTWFAGAVLAVSGGGAIGAVAGALVGFFYNAGLIGPALGLPVGMVVGLLLGVLAALTIAPALAWFLHLPALQGSSRRRVVSAARFLVATLTVMGWSLLALITSNGVGAAIGNVRFWLILAVLVSYGRWATPRVVKASNVASGSTRR
jgi:hypothetical protein